VISIFTGPVINFTYGSTGTYLLYLRISEPITIRIPKQEITIDKGYYLYVGSAFGAGGLTSRIHRHLRRKKKNHWHIDQITMSKHCSMHGIAAFLNEKIECQIAQKLTVFDKIYCINNVGNSDCKNNCLSHLFKIEVN